jgi:hypothetical protein
MNKLVTSQSMNGVNFTTANTLYKNAVAASPNNAEANFGAGLTEIFMIAYDTSIINMIERWQGVNLGKNSAQTSTFFKFGIPSGTKDMSIPAQAVAQNLAKIVQTATTNPPLIGEMQNLMRDKLLPYINYALDRFAVVEQSDSLRYVISGKMQGNSSLHAVYLDNTEVYTMHGVLLGLKALVETFLVYRFDLPAYNTKAVVQALQQSNTTFFYRASDGVTRSQSIYNGLLGMAGKFQSAINHLKSETHDQTYDIIKIGPDLKANDLDTALAYLGRALIIISTPQTVQINNGGTDGDNYTLQVNIKNFFDNPPLNPKQAWFPTYTVDTSSSGSILWHWQAQDYASFTFPDPSFSGLFTSITDNTTQSSDRNDNLKRLLYIDIPFSWQVEVYLYDNNGQLSTTFPPRLLINNKTYTPHGSLLSSQYLSPWYSVVYFYVKDNAGQIAQVVANLDGVDETLLLTSNAIVTYKSYQYIYGDVTQASQNMTYYLNTYGSPYIQLYFNDYNNYMVERSTNGGSFSGISSSSSYYYYYDYGVSAGNTYQYRAKVAPPSYYLGDYGIYAYRANNYTNTVTVTFP